MIRPKMSADMGDGEAHLYILDAIGTRRHAEDKRKDLTATALQEALSDIPLGTKVTVHINSMGGDLVEALGIYNILRSRGVDTVCEGLAASAASLIFCAGQNRTMRPASLLFVHQPSCMSIGTAEQLEKTADDLRKLGDVVVGAYLATGTKKTEDELREELKAETWYTADEALAAGFATKIDKDDEADDETGQSTAQDALCRLVKMSRERAGGALSAPGDGETLEDIKKDLREIKGVLAKTASQGAGQAAREDVGRQDKKGFFGFGG